jgi:hypothetical protein
MGASTYTKEVHELTIMGNKRVHVVKYTCTSYGTDGLPLTNAIAGLSQIDHVIGIIINGAGLVANGPVCATWNAATGYIFLLKASNSGVDAGTNISTAGTIDVIVVGV